MYLKNGQFLQHAVW